MKFNKWTLGLAAVGVVSLASAARADEKMSSLQTALSNTTISGYVSASFNWAISPGGENALSSLGNYIPFQGQSYNKQDGFNLDVVKLSIAKPQDESPWASGYQIDLLFGPDAVGYNASANAVGGNNGKAPSSTETADFAIKQAYVVLRTPIGNGIDWKVGVFDTIIGYEVFDSGSDPNYTRSWGYFLEPTEHTGVLGTYKINDEWSVALGVANTLTGSINARDLESGYGPAGVNGWGSAWHKTVMGSLTFTAPSSWGWAAGSSLYAGAIYGFPSGVFTIKNQGYAGDYQLNWYGGATINTPWKQLTAGLAFDYVEHFDAAPVNIWDIGLYATYKATDKLSFSARGEYVDSDVVAAGFPSSDNPDWMELTGTMEYDLWANVISRLEIRYDHVLDNRQYLSDALGYAVGGDSETPYALNNWSSIGVYANIIYKF